MSTAQTHNADPATQGARHPLDPIRAVLELYKIGRSGESTNLPSALHVDASTLRALKKVIAFVEFAEGMDWTAHNEDRSRELSRRATAILAPTHILASLA